jgi:hypothetical protein
MPIVALDLTDDEAARVDTVAELEKRSRKGQVHILFLEGLTMAEIRKLEELAETTNTGAESCLKD